MIWFSFLLAVQFGKNSIGETRHWLNDLIFAYNNMTEFLLWIFVDIVVLDNFDVKVHLTAEMVF